MQPFSRNQRPDLLTSLINKCLVLRLLRKMHLCRSSSNVPRLHTPAIVFGNATKPARFAHFLTRSTIPCACHAKAHLNVQKSEHGAFSILTWKCASRHNGVNFFDISTSKRCPRMVCFVQFDLEMCFAPQRCALFRHRNFQKWSENVVFCTF